MTQMILALAIGCDGRWKLLEGAGSEGSFCFQKKKLKRSFSFFLLDYFCSRDKDANCRKTSVGVGEAGSGGAVRFPVLPAT